MLYRVNMNMQALHNVMQCYAYRKRKRKNDEIKKEARIEPG